MNILSVLERLENKIEHYFPKDKLTQYSRRSKIVGELSAGLYLFDTRVAIGTFREQ